MPEPASQAAEWEQSLRSVRAQRWATDWIHPAAEQDNPTERAGLLIRALYH